MNTGSEPGRPGPGSLDTALRRCCWSLGLALAVLVVLALALWLGAHRQAHRLVAVELGDVRLERAPGATTGLEAWARLRLTNRTPVRFSLAGMRYRVEAGGREVARGLWAPAAPLELPARGSADVDLHAAVDTEHLAAAALAILGGSTAGARIEADIDVKWLLGRVTVPVTVQRSLGARTAPASSVEER